MVKLAYIVAGIFFLSTALARNNFTKNYNVLNYNTANSRREYERRSSGLCEDANKAPLRIRFSAYNRFFHLVLRPITPDSGPFSSGLTVLQDGEIHEIRPHHFLYEGYVKGDTRSQVYGSLFDGLFDGHIYLSDGNSYTAEKAAKYYSANDRPATFHSLIYHDNEDHMSSVRREPVNLHATNASGDEKLAFVRRERPSIYTLDEKKRYNVRTCSMHLQADQKLYEEILNKEGNNDPSRTREEIVSMFYIHMRAVNDIYENTNFNGIQGLNFAVKRISINSTHHCYQSEPISEEEHFCKAQTDADKYLHWFSSNDHSNFCLAYAIAYTHFEKGCIGVAYLATDPYLSHGDGMCGRYRKNRGSRNTAAVTLQSKGNRMPARMVQITIAHELGHSLGTHHDSKISLMNHIDASGKYLMYYGATYSAGDKPNHAKLSQQSIDRISAMLHSVLKFKPYDPARENAPGGFKGNCLQSAVLDKFGDDFDILNYNTHHAQNDRVRRASEPSDDPHRPLRIQFYAHFRSFNLVIRPIAPNSLPFANGFTADVDEAIFDVQPHRFLYEGYNEGYPGSRVYGSLFDGIFDGHIHFSDGNSYTVEKTAKYYANVSLYFHSVIYHDNKAQRELVQRSNTSRDVRYARRKNSTLNHNFDAKRAGGSTVFKFKSRRRYGVRACSTLLQADHMLYHEVFTKEGKRDPTRTREEIISIMYIHVRSVNYIYRNTDFNGIKGVRFAIKRISMYTPDSCSWENYDNKLTANPFCDGTVDANRFLDQHSFRDHSMYCLAYAFTYREFADGTLGLAWLAYPGYGSPGLCANYEENEYSEGRFVSLNSAIVTLSYRGKRMPPRKSQLVIAHELGHSLGADHDNRTDIQSPEGDYIMYPTSEPRERNRPNHAKFSQKSIDEISAVLDRVLRMHSQAQPSAASP